jgi:hypothetical protein
MKMKAYLLFLGGVGLFSRTWNVGMEFQRVLVLLMGSHVLGFGGVGLFSRTWNVGMEFHGVLVLLMGSHVLGFDRFWFVEEEWLIWISDSNEFRAHDSCGMIADCLVHSYVCSDGALQGFLFRLRPSIVLVSVAL